MMRIVVFKVVFIVAINSVVLMSGCAGDPPRPVLPDGLHRVPVNRVSPVPPMPPVPPVPPVTSPAGGRDEG
ncbi:hypothetical protein PWR63_04840 [Paraburkholderia sp. A2WS-5]|uniref:hypothetical protein n=1 Tax=Paraburkholderia sp. A2WS-5 TaxID=3028372 RepID=UPI003B7A6A19